LGDGSIRKTVVEYTTNDKGQKVQIVKKVKIYLRKTKVNKRVQERKQWRKFGECRDAPQGPEKGITSVGDEIFLELSNEAQGNETKVRKELANLGIVCRNCGKTGDHWTLKCPYFKIESSSRVVDPHSEQRPSASHATPGVGSSGPGMYVPPSLRAGAGAHRSEGDLMRPRRDETATIRVTNLSEDTKESDLSDLFRTFGPISRIYLAKDKITGLSKGFAFINFVHREDAARAIEKLSGYGYDHLILHVEWAKPSNK